MTTLPYLRIQRLTKTFGAFTALDNITLEIAEGEFVCFLGPSGCGKTTLLRAIAGLDIQTSGRIEQGGRDISALPPTKRDFGIVFQSYALFPNLTAAKNVAYGLENARAKRAEVAKRVRELLDMIGLGEHGGKYPAQLSGGQQQRVALARALATSPGLLLLDEPLSALDAKVRVHLRHEVKQLQRRVGVTTIMVTHDQEEALTMSDRLAVFNAGRIEQIGTPAEVYEHPQSEFVAGFVGVSNVLERGGTRFTVRPEKIHMRDDDGGSGEAGRVRDVVYVGMVTRYVVELDGGGELVVVRQNLETSSQEALEARGRRVRLEWKPEHTFVIEEENQS